MYAFKLSTKPHHMFTILALDFLTSRAHFFFWKWFLHVPSTTEKKIFSYFVKFCCDFLELLSFENSSETPYLLIFFSFSSPFSSCCNDLAKKKKKKKYNNLIMFLNYYFFPISVGQQNKYTFYIGIEKIFDFIFFSKMFSNNSNQNWFWMIL